EDIGQTCPRNALNIIEQPRRVRVIVPPSKSSNMQLTLIALLPLVGLVLAAPTPSSPSSPLLRRDPDGGGSGWYDLCQGSTFVDKTSNASPANSECTCIRDRV